MTVEEHARVALGPWRVGPVFGLGALFPPYVRDARDRIEVKGGALANLGFAVGAALPRWRWLQPEVELVGGAQLVNITLVHPDAASTTGMVTRASAVLRPLVEARAALDFWLGPHVSVAVWTSDDLAAPDQPAVGLAIEIHTLAWAGTP